MHEYDVVLKLLLQGSAQQTMLELTGSSVSRWLNVELPELVQNTRLDLLGESADGQLIHLELQSTNDPQMALRMAEYSLRVYRLFGKFPRQILLYVGESPLRMPAGLDGADFIFRYHPIDIRTLDGDELLRSPHLGDNVIAVLARLQDAPQAVRQIVSRIVQLEQGERNIALG